MARKKRKRRFNSFLRIFFWLCLIIVGAWYGVNLFFIQPHVFYPGFQIEIPTGYQIHGIDVSRYQSVVNWAEVKNMEDNGIKVGFAFIKATEGTNIVDGQFRRNWIGAEGQNIPKGAYHFFVPGKNVQQQAKNFIQIVNLQNGDIPPVLDVEIRRRVSVAEMQKEVKEWLDAIEDHYGVKAIIYTNIDFYQRYFQTGFEAYPVWIAHYLQPDKPGIEHKWTFWQHSENGRVDGINGPVDFNVFYGDSLDFKSLLIAK